MKRFGLPILLSAIYVTVMLLVFSSDYSKENTFLYPDNVQEVADIPSSDEEEVDEPSPKPIPSIAIAPSTEGEDPDQKPATPVQAEPAHHSPEAPDGE